MRKLKNYLNVLALFLVVSLISASFSIFFAKDYHRTEIGNDRYIFVDKDGVPLDVNGSYVALDGQLVRQSDRLASQTFFMNDETLLTITASRNLLSYFYKNRDALINYDKITDQNYLQALYNTYYVEKTAIPSDVNPISQDEYEDNLKNGFIRAYKYYAWVNQGDSQVIKPILAYTTFSSTEDQKAMFEGYKKIKGYTFDFEDMFILE